MVDNLIADTLLLICVRYMSSIYWIYICVTVVPIFCGNTTVVLWPFDRVRVMPHTFK